ncbi:MAG TPA: anti-CBASS Acb1 family protein [Allocoleopsis sp.]
MTDEARFDGPLQNVLTGLGVSTYDPGRHLQIGVLEFLSRDEQSRYYRTSWACRKVVDVMPKYMTKRWGYLKMGGKSGKADIAGAIAKYHKRLQVKNSFRRAQTLANLRGNAGIVILADDLQEDYSKPLDLKKLRSIRGLRVLDRYQLYPDLTGWWDRLNDDAKPEYFNLISTTSKVLDNKGSAIVIGSKIHGSRVLWFRGAELDEHERLRNQGCDDSVLVNFIGAFKRYYAAYESGAAIAQSIDVIVHKIKNLGTTLLTGGRESETRLTERLRVNQISKSVYRGYAVDMDNEDISVLSRNAGGISDIMESLKGELCAASGLPPSVFYAQFASGLDSSGESHSERETLNDEVQSAQEEKLDDNLLYLNELIFQANDGPTKGKIPDDWDWEWHQLYSPTPDQIADLKQKYSSIDATYIGSQVLTADEVASSRFGGAEYSTEIVLDMEARKKAKEAAEKQAEADANFSADDVEELPPEGEAIAPDAAETDFPADEEAENLEEF